MRRIHIMYPVMGGCLAIIMAVMGWWGRSVAAQTPELTIVSPAPGEVISGNKVKVIVALPDSFSLTEYHLHLWLDAVPTHDDAVSVVLSNTTEHNYREVFSGLHTLYSELLRNDHIPYEPRLTALVEFETIGEELKPVPDSKRLGKEAPPEVRGSLFLPRGKGNTVMAIILILLVSFILWYVLGQKRK